MSDDDFYFEDDDDVPIRPATETSVDASPTSMSLEGMCLSVRQLLQLATDLMGGQLADTLEGAYGVQPLLTEYDVPLRAVIDAVLLLLLSKRAFNVQALSEEWFAGSLSLTRDFLPSGAVVSSSISDPFLCPTLYIAVPLSETLGLPCGHRHSVEAYSSYVLASLTEGHHKLTSLACLSLNCPLPLPFSSIENLLPADKRLRANEFYASSLVQADPRHQFCPYPGCAEVVRVPDSILKQPPLALLTSGDATLSCSAQHQWCGLCGGEPHGPFPCDIIKKWHAKGQSEADSMNWILVHTKLCPKCKTPIEKNHGCMHMTCRCGHHFCWICMADWVTHRPGPTAYSCNEFNPDLTSDSVKKDASESLNRYLHYISRYAAHEQAQKVASEKLHKVLLCFSHRSESNSNTELRQIQGGTLLLMTISTLVDASYYTDSADIETAVGTEGAVTQVSFVEVLQSAVEEVISARRLLKYTYAWAFFVDWDAFGCGKVRQPENVTRTPDFVIRHLENELERTQLSSGQPPARPKLPAASKQARCKCRQQVLFEHTQGLLEKTIDHLQELTENLDTFASRLIQRSAESPIQPEMASLTSLKTAIMDATRVCKQYFKRMVDVLGDEFVEDYEKIAHPYKPD